MTLVKICGIANLEDAEVAVSAGADALGFNFYPKSPRYIQPGVARDIKTGLPTSVLKVGVFVNEEIEKIVEIVEMTGIDAIQLHGDETGEFVDELKMKTGLEIIKAFRVSDDFRPKDVVLYNIDAVLLDAYSPTEHGGTGKTFDWEIAKAVKVYCAKMYLAGGLSPENVSDAIRAVGPYAVDASSRLECSPGKKDASKVEAFISAVKGIK